MNETLHRIGHNILAIIRKLQIENLKIEGYRNRNSFKEDKDNKTIAFIANYPQGWNSFKMIFEEIKNKKNCKVVLIGYVNDRYPNSTELFWKSIDKNAVIARKGEIPSIEDMSIDVVFRETPYDDEFPKEYSARELSKFAKLCYIPYGYQMSKGIHLQSEYNDWFFPFLTAIYACNEPSYNYCISKAMSHKSTCDIKVFNYGYPRFELLKQSGGKRLAERFLWIPRWSVDDIHNNGTSFFKYSELLCEYFDNNRSLSLIIRPHPLMFKNFVKQRYMTEDEVIQYKKRIEGVPNVFLDEESDYLISFNRVDAMIADYSTLIVEFFASGKPILYCGEIGGVNEEIVKMLSLMYLTSSWDDLERNIRYLSAGFDPIYEDRQQYINSFFQINSCSISKRIADSCLNEI